MGSEILYPIMPAFLTLLGASRTTIGAIEGVAEGLPALIKLFSGALADRVRNRKWLVLTGYALSTLFKPLVAFAQSSVFVLVVRIFDRIGKGIRTAPRDALVADFTDKTRLGYTFGYQRGMDHAGALVYAAFAFVKSAWGVWALFVVYGVFYGLTEGAARAVIADLVPEGQRGTAFGFWGMLEGLLLLTGWLWDRTGSGVVPLLFCGGAALVAAAGLGCWGTRGGLRR
jgi:MFS-type transporter involved in bile tolerance (Atg22 family)